MNPTGHTSYDVPRLGVLVFSLLLLLPIGVAHGLITVGRGNDPVKDNNWPAGSLAVANLKTRVGWVEGPPFGGGQHGFLYRGDTKAFQEALDLFAKIKAPELRLVVHPGTNQSTFLKDEKNPKADTSVNWTFTVWNPDSYHRLFNDPKTQFMADDPRFRQKLEAPVIDVWVGEGGGIDWKQVQVPKNVTLSDERASAAKIDAAGGAVIRGEAYDLATGRVMPGAHVAVEKNKGRDAWEKVASAKSGADGRFEMKGVPPGNYRVTASAEGYAPRQLAYVQLEQDVLKQFTVNLSPEVKLTGTVTDTEGRPLAGVKVRADSVTGIDGHGYASPVRREVTTDEKGRYTIGGLPKGNAYVIAHVAGFHQVDPLALRSLPGEVNLPMAVTGNVRGRVLTLAGEPVAGKDGDVSISIEPAAGAVVGSWGGSMNVKPDGTFAFDGVPPGKYLLGTNLHAARAGKNANAKLIEVKPGETVQVDVTQ